MKIYASIRKRLNLAAIIIAGGIFLMNYAAAADVINCDGAQKTGLEYGVDGSEINVRKGPGASYERIINQKTTEVLGKTHYVQIDFSVTVFEVCRKGEWSFIQVSQPQSLKDSHKGWVASRFLGTVERDSGGFQIFTEKDFLWDENIAPYKAVIVAGVNKIHRENERCKEIDPVSAYISEKSTPGKPAFFVTCGSGSRAFNVWFSEDDLKNGENLQAKKHISRSMAIGLCEQYARNAAAFPSTVDFSRFFDLAVDEHPNGRTAVVSSFTAKNAFNLEIKFNIRCLIDATGTIEAAINEAE